MADALNGSLEVAVLKVFCLERSPHGEQVIVRLLVVVKHKEETLPNFFGLAHPDLQFVTHFCVTTCMVAGLNENGKK